MARKRGRTWVAVLVAGILVAIFFPMVLRQYYPYSYRTLIERYASEFRLDPLLIAAIIRVESNFRPDVNSRMGAIGLMQLMPTTGLWVARQMALPLGAGGPDLEKPAVNVRIGCWYLRYLLNRHHDLDAVLAAYNAGEANIPRWRSPKHHQKSLAITYPETRQFLQRCRRTYRIYRLLYGS